MAYYNICFSPTGGTEQVAGILAAALEQAWQSIDLSRPVPQRSLTEEDICLVSVPSYGGRVPAAALERLGAIRGRGARAILVCVYGNREWDDTLTELQDTLEAQGFRCAAAVAAVAEHSLFRQYAAGRPDASDAAQLTDFARQIRRKLDAGSCGPLTLAGSHGSYRAFGGVPFHPEADAGCTRCGLCAEACPVGAIPPEQPQKCDKTRCISCMRCVRLCPTGARKLNPLVMKAVGAAMAAKLGGRKENHLFL